MREYNLNSSPVRTSENYGINDIKLKLDIPSYKRFDNFSFFTEELSSIDVDILEHEEKQENKLASKIGLEFDKYKKIVIRVPQNIQIKEPIILDYLFDEDNAYLVDCVEVILEKGSKATFIINYGDEYVENKFFHMLKQTTILKENSNAHFIIANLINNNSDSFISIENDVGKNATLTHTLIELGGEKKVSNYFTTMSGDYGKNIIKNIYLGTGEDIIDINYNIEVLGKYTECNIESQGAIQGRSSKNFKGTIDFKKGAQKSKGVENENCMILSDTAKSKSLPMLLCHEEDVNGEHGVSSGKLDESQLFYIMTKGISYNEAKKLIVKANFNSIIKQIPSDELQERILEMVDNTI